MSDGAALFKAERKRAVAYYTLLRFYAKTSTVLAQRVFRCTKRFFIFENV
jgi:hypothetical protein